MIRSGGFVRLYRRQSVRNEFRCMLQGFSASLKKCQCQCQYQWGHFRSVDKGDLRSLFTVHRSLFAVADGVGSVNGVGQC
jgi:hypothetical protein